MRVWRAHRPYTRDLCAHPRSDRFVTCRSDSWAATSLEARRIAQSPLKAAVIDTRYFTGEEGTIGPVSRTTKMRPAKHIEHPLRSRHSSFNVGAAA